MPKPESKVGARLQAVSGWLSESAKVVGEGAKLSLETGFLKEIVTECGEGLGMASALCKLGAFAIDKATPDMPADVIIAHRVTDTFWKTLDEQCANWEQPVEAEAWTDYVREHLDERTSRALAGEFSWMSVITPDGQLTPARNWGIVRDFVGLAETWLHATGMEPADITPVKQAVGEAIVKTLNETIEKADVLDGFRALIDDIGTQAVKALVELQTGLADTLLFGETKQSDLYVPSRAKIADLTFGGAYPLKWDDVKPAGENAEDVLLAKLREDDKQLVVVEGEMGIGKSCLMRRITAQLSEEYTTGGREPILVRWKDLYERRDELQAAVKDHLRREYDVSVPDLTLGDNTLLLVDGFDEMTSHDPTFIAGCFRRLAELYRDGCTVVVAMRTPVVTAGMKDEWTQLGALVCHVLPFAKAQVDAWAERWADSKETEDVTGDALRGAAGDAGTDGVTQVPLLLYMVAKYVLPRTTGDVPLNRTAVFRVFVDETIRGQVENSAAQRVQTTADYEPVAYRLLLQELAAIASWPKSGGVCRPRDIEDVIPESARKRFSFARGITPFVLHFFSPTPAHGEFHFYPEGFREYLLAEWSVRQQLEWRQLRGAGHEELCRSDDEARRWLGELALRAQEMTFLDGIYEELGALAREQSDDLARRLRAFGCQAKDAAEAAGTVEALYEAARAYADYPNPPQQWGVAAVSVGSPEDRSLPPAYNDLTKVYNALTQCWVATLGLCRGLGADEPILQRDTMSLAQYLHIGTAAAGFEMRVEIARDGRFAVARSNALRLSEANLAGIYLHGVALGAVRLRGANLSRGLLVFADLEGADLSHADLRQADCTGAGLRGANLQGGRLHKAQLPYSALSHARLEDADMSEADLGGADLSHADVSNANICRADLTYADLADLSTYQEIANIQGANIHDVQNAPEGFTEWALEHGAVQKDLEAWEAFKENGYQESFAEADASAKDSSPGGESGPDTG
ncbi:NACHT domain-containing protein [Candidatus Poribacteria bacterium]|nr:NACHT domain-containing protein [Candidatus Poribacteria bacterium]MBT5533433.1 NACHT domain-containing protein [Candidatus Poribacteria bacterium]